jgi:hypothetical protein
MTPELMITQQAPQEPSPERQRQIKQAQFLVQLYEENRVAIRKAAAVIPVEHLDRNEIVNDDMRQSYYLLVAGALLAQDIPVHEARILADHIAAFTFNELRARPEAGHA